MNDQKAPAKPDQTPPQADKGSTDNRISISVKFIALKIGNREIRLTPEEALTLRNELDRLLNATRG